MGRVKQFLSRITGISTPFVGISWQAKQQDSTTSRRTAETSPYQGHLREVFTDHPENWCIRTGMINQNAIYLNEITESFDKWAIEFLEVTFKYNFPVETYAHTITAEVHFRYKSADTPDNHLWQEVLNNSLQPTSKRKWKKCMFAVSHPNIRQAWLSFTLLGDSGITIRIRGLKTQMKVRERSRDE